MPDFLPLARAPFYALLALLALLAPPELRAESAEDASLSVSIDPGWLSAVESEAGQRALTERLAALAAARLRAAGARLVEVEPTGPGRLLASARLAGGRDALAALLIGAGRLELRPLLNQRALIEAIGLDLAPGLAVRIGPHGPALWSAQRAPIAASARSIAMPNAELFALPDPDGGWRSALLGPPLAGADDLAAARTERGARGEALFVLELKGAAARRWAALERGAQIAIAIDGEAVAIVRRGAANANGTLRTSCLRAPEGPAPASCARLIAGRLSGPLPPGRSLIPVPAPIGARPGRSEEGR